MLHETQQTYHKEFYRARYPVSSVYPRKIDGPFIWYHLTEGTMSATLLRSKLAPLLVIFLFLWAAVPLTSGSAGRDVNS